MDILDDNTKKKLRQKSIEDYLWPKGFTECINPLESFSSVVDINNLQKTISQYDKNLDIFLSFLSKEYLVVGQMWYSYFSKSGNKQHLIIVTDKASVDFCKKNSITHFVCLYPEKFENDTSYLSKTGFSKKGLAITALKFPFVKFLVQSGYNTFLVDIDALILQSNIDKFTKGADISFQRVVYFPRSISEIWGFAICSGFIWFKSNSKVCNLLDRVINMQKITYSDQAAINIVLFEGDICWLRKKEQKKLSLLTNQKLFELFSKEAPFIIDGYCNSLDINLKALPPTSFWRNDIIPFEKPQIIVFHPNSAKKQEEKLETYKKYGFY